MSSTALLGIVQTVCGELGLPQPTTVVGTTTMQVKQMVAFANVVGDGLRDEYNWPVLRQTATITTINGASGYTVSNGAYTCSRIINETGWDATNSWYFVGSVNDVEWAQWQYGIMATPIRRIWRTTDDDAIEVFPVPTVNGDTLTVSFVTDLWARAYAGTPKSTMSADDDVHLFNDRLFIVGTKWRFLEAKGLPFAAPLNEWNDILGKRKAAARPQRTVSLDNRSMRRRRFVDYRNVPDTGFGT